MAVTIQDLLDLIDANFDVVQLIDRGTTAGGLVYEYDLWYRTNSVVHYKRVHIYWDGNVDNDAEWYQSNPIPQEAEETFLDKLNAWIELAYTNPNIKLVTVEHMDSYNKVAELRGAWLPGGTTYTISWAYVYEDENGDIQWDGEFYNES